jgi:hypothetical protein
MAQSIKCNGNNNDDARNDFLDPISEIKSLVRLTEMPQRRAVCSLEPIA